MNRFVGGASLVACVLAFVACTGTSSEERDDSPGLPSGAPGALQAAHEAYLDGDFLALGERIRDVLLDPRAGALAKENAYELLEKAYEVQGGSLPSKFELGAPFEGGLQYGHIRGTYAGPHRPWSQVYARFPIRDAARVTGFTVRRLPDEIVLDKATGRGKLETIKHDDPGYGYEDFKIELLVDELPADGVFTVRIELDDGAVSDGWFIVHGLAASATPELHSPVASQSFSEPNPVMRWVPFRSPEYRGFERRTLSIWTTNERVRSFQWGFWTNQPGELGQLELGGADRGQLPGGSSASLAPDDYWVMLGYSEERSFGPVRLHRWARADASFHVVPR